MKFELTKNNEILVTLDEREAIRLSQVIRFGLDKEGLPDFIDDGVARRFEMNLCRLHPVVEFNGRN